VPTWLSSLVKQVRDTNSLIKQLEQNMQKEVDSMGSALSTHDANFMAVHTRLAQMEAAQSGAVTAAVQAAIDTKLESFRSELAWLKARPAPSSTAVSSAPSSAGGQRQQGSGSTGDQDKVRQQTFDLLKNGGRPIGNFRLGVNGYQGLVHLSSPDDAFELYYIKGATETGFQCEPNLESFRYRRVADKDVLQLLVGGSVGGSCWPIGRQLTFAVASSTDLCLAAKDSFCGSMYDPEFSLHGFVDDLAMVAAGDVREQLYNNSILEHLDLDSLWAELSAIPGIPTGPLLVGPQVVLQIGLPSIQPYMRSVSSMAVVFLIVRVRLV
ncbi:unnamed protein product, partial [Prorocentrum cordatum]